jgi:hypothetical protein
MISCTMATIVMLARWKVKIYTGQNMDDLYNTTDIIEYEYQLKTFKIPKSLYDAELTKVNRLILALDKCSGIWINCNRVLYIFFGTIYYRFIYSSKKTISELVLGQLPEDDVK